MLSMSISFLLHDDSHCLLNSIKQKTECRKNGNWISEAGLLLFSSIHPDYMFPVETRAA